MIALFYKRGVVPNGSMSVSFLLFRVVSIVWMVHFPKDKAFIALDLLMSLLPNAYKYLIVWMKLPNVLVDGDTFKIVFRGRIYFLTVLAL